MNTRLLLADDIDKVHAFELSQLSAKLSPIQAEMESWEQPWRKESLAHYAQLGWSFLAMDGDQVKGYVLGQPILFFNNWTQTLWIESLSFADDKIGFELMDVAIRWSKTKHLQKVLVNGKAKQLDFIQTNFTGFKENTYFHLSTTKINED